MYPLTPPPTGLPSETTLVTVYAVMYTISVLFGLLISARAWRGYFQARRNGPAQLVSEKAEIVRSGLAWIAAMLAVGSLAFIAYLVF